MQQTTPDLETAGKVAGVIVAALALLSFGRKALRWTIRLLVTDAFRPELARGEHSAASIIAVTKRLDDLEATMVSNAELLAQIPLLVAGHERIEKAVDETREDVKKILLALGEVRGRSHFGELKP